VSLALDTNILVYVLIGDPDISGPARRALQESGQSGQGLTISPPVYAELLAVPMIGKTAIDEFLREAKILVDWISHERCWVNAGVAYAAYALRRKRQKVGPPRRLLADFIIGAHAMELGSILTADPKFYRTNFPELRVITP
jgi:predicted nucleic acid-binding protein